MWAGAPTPARPPNPACCFALFRAVSGPLAAPLGVLSVRRYSQGGGGASGLADAPSELPCRPPAAAEPPTPHPAVGVCAAPSAFVRPCGAAVCRTSAALRRAVAHSFTLSCRRGVVPCACLQRSVASFVSLPRVDTLARRSHHRRLSKAALHAMQPLRTPRTTGPAFAHVLLSRRLGDASTRPRACR